MCEREREREGERDRESERERQLADGACPPDCPVCARKVYVREAESVCV